MEGQGGEAEDGGEEGEGVTAGLSRGVRHLLSGRPRGGRLVVVNVESG